LKILLESPPSAAAVHYVSRIILLVMVLSAAVLLVAGPTAEPTIPPDRRGDTILEYWEKWSGDESAAMGRIVDDFNNSVGREKHIYVHYLSMTNITQKTLAAAAAGVPPDIAGSWHDVLAQFAALGALEPLDDLAAAHGITADYYKPVYWKSCHHDGHLYALVSTPGAVALFYNTKIFHDSADKLRAAGLDPDQPPQTLQELDRYAEALDVWDTGPDGKKRLVRAGYLPEEPGWYLTETPTWFGANIWDPQTHQFNFDSPQVVASLKWVASYAQRLGLDQVERFGGSVKNFDTPQNHFLAGNVAMVQQGPWLALYIHRWRPDMDGHWAAAAFPSAVPGQRDVTFCPFDDLVIPSGCKHKAEAFEFIAFVNRQDEMEKLCSSHCKNSPLAKVSENFIRHHSNPYISVFERLASGPNAHGPMDLPIAPEVGKDIYNLFQSVAILDTDPAAGAAAVQRSSQAKWAQFARKMQLRQEAEN
jgi:ABC-type glycerol-3-phosphate transport system substrate-binding protein